MGSDSCNRSLEIHASPPKSTIKVVIPGDVYRKTVWVLRSAGFHVAAVKVIALVVCLQWYNQRKITK